MSRAYVIRVAAGVRRIVQVADGVCTDIELLPILPRERLSDLLARELEGRGFTVEEGTARRDDGDGIRIEVDVKTGQVSARVEQDQEVERTLQRGVRAVAPQLDDKVRQEVEAELQKEAERQVKQVEQKLQQEVTTRLERKLKDIQQELDDVSNKVAAAALKEKAAQLGEITELSEEAGGGLTIKVKV